MQCRTGHAEYYSKFVPTKNIDCPCGENLQTREHILRECTQYEHHRYILRDASPDISLQDKNIGDRQRHICSVRASGAFTRDGKPRKTPKEPIYVARSVWDFFDDMLNSQVEGTAIPEADWRDEVVDPNDLDGIG
ncbi:hypothetical protein BT96DRAFT_917499 [Gymnopus androsaceus JB14]|uniref:Uncharacterized protein n=1 Tax=Gymnopus androsaceus JB14 TaxID=1447944 RepID=A0A6A4HYV7_9AGAR|nr:hypothetical protein BT96DRAFT_917499 [Gymnopus androsaceus JB14]